MKLILYISAMLLSANAAARTDGAELRKWTDRTGQFEFVASLVSRTETHATLKGKDGKVRVVKLADLSVGDRLYIKRQGKAAPVKRAIAQRLTGHKRPIRFLTFDSKGDTLFSADDQQLSRWNLGDKRPRPNVLAKREASHVSISANGEFVGFVGGGRPGAIGSLYQYDEGDFLITQMNNGPISLAVSEDATLLALGFANGKVKLVSPGKKKDNGHNWEIVNQRGNAVKVELSPKGTRLAAVSPKGDISIYEFTNNWKESTTIDTGLPLVDIRFDAKWTKVATCHPNGVVRLWKLSDGKRLLERESTKAVTVDFTRDGGQLICAGGSRRSGQLVVINVAAPHTTHTVAVTGNMVSAIALSSDGKRLATGGMDGQIRLWKTGDLVNGK